TAPEPVGKHTAWVIPWRSMMRCQASTCCSGAMPGEHELAEQGRVPRLIAGEEPRAPLAPGRRQVPPDVGLALQDVAVRVDYRRALGHEALPPNPFSTARRAA